MRFDRADALHPRTRVGTSARAIDAGPEFFTIPKGAWATVTDDSDLAGSIYVRLDEPIQGLPNNTYRHIPGEPDMGPCPFRVVEEQTAADIERAFLAHGGVEDQAPGSRYVAEREGDAWQVRDTRTCTCWAVRKSSASAATMDYDFDEIPEPD